MYELEQGTERLATALNHILDNPLAIQSIAYRLNYEREQLMQDIQALNDFYQLHSNRTNGEDK